MKHPPFALIATTASAVLLVTAASTASASAAHDYFPESYESTRHFTAGEGPCVAWAGTQHEVRDGGYRLVTPSGGQRDGEMHANGAIDGILELVPDDPSLPTYVGSYREKVNSILVGTDGNGDDVGRIGQYRVRMPLVGSDGSRLLLTMSGKLTVNGNGVTTVAKDDFRCG
ncbi:hypothetical protein [Knoellia sp. Soil729]|uniref:hypothetical protein n=1 Tax=Knoellia sp. Soil729 TaxID=1736394 RepID=UPI0006F5F978|nr:hypothetical protein [Knoellia sp. Soil729]KRE42164.1 hypothetical protein ASG74_06800 [Knoellia sp. Soil729]